MPISPETRQITEREWEDRKLRICELYITLGRRLEGHDGVIETMANEGFTATVPQYEHRFRKWSVRKNIKRAEWERIFHDTQQGGERAQINQTISKPKPQRARRRYTPRIRQGEEPVSRNHDATTIAPDVDTEMDGVESRQDMRLASPKTNPIAVDCGISMMDFSDLNPLQHAPVSLIWDSNPSCSGVPFTVRLAPLNPLQANRNIRWLWLPSLPSSQFVTRVIEDILAKTSDPHLLEKFSNAMTKPEFTPGDPKSPLILNIFKSLYSLENFAGEDWSLIESQPTDIALEARFDGRLIASIINGFSGFENVLASGVLEVLHRHRAIQQVVIGGLEAQSSPVAKSSAENLFLIYLQTDNTEAIKYLLNTRLVDANKAVYHFNGERYTPLETAAINQSFKVLRFLISEGADINKSFPRTFSSNAFQLLFKHLDSRRPILDDNLLSLVDAFFEAGAAISMRTVYEAFRLADPRLTIGLFKKIVSQAPQVFILQQNMLKDIIMDLEEECATSAIKLIINSCQRLGLARCLSKLYLCIGDTLEVPMNRRYYSLTKTLSPSSISSDGELSWTMARDSHSAVVNPMPQKDPTLDRDIDLDRDTEDSDIFISKFISALRSGDQNSLRFLEERGVLNYLQDYRLGEALTEALRAGNLEYATKVLDLDPDFKFRKDEYSDLNNDRRFDVATAMDAALAHGFNDIAWKLLTVGITTPTYLTNPPPAPLLYIAVVRKRPDFVRTIIECGCDPEIFREPSYKEWPILNAAIEYSEDSVFDNILKICPHPLPFSDRLFKLALRGERVDLFLEIFKYSSQDLICKAQALEAAVEYENESVLDELISLGAGADNDDILKKAISDHPSMVRPLLDRFWKAYPEGRAGYGWYIVSNALDNYLMLPKLLDQVFSWGLVRLNVNYQVSTDKETLLSYAIDTENFDVVKRFVDAGGDVNIITWEEKGHDYTRATPLWTAIRTGIEEIVQLLVDNGADVNKLATNGIRRTPLQKAAEMNNLSIVRLLLKNGARVNGKPATFHGATALQFAAIRGNCEIATLLIEHGAEYNIPPPIGRLGRWPLEGAAENGRLDMIELLWNAPWDPLDDKQCRSAMRYAEKNGHFGCKEKIEELMTRSSARDNIL
ncbi:hypothetical protein F4814DRAFT_455509 [Daldinia grandis]|nr:hypothetical protein F4814DRAFT_455509 [Daldinia grandis]